MICRIFYNLSCQQCSCLKESFSIYVVILKAVPIFWIKCTDSWFLEINVIMETSWLPCCSVRWCVCIYSVAPPPPAPGRWLASRHQCYGFFSLYPLKCHPCVDSTNNWWMTEKRERSGSALLLCGHWTSIWSGFEYGRFRSSIHQHTYKVDIQARTLLC